MARLLTVAALAAGNAALVGLTALWLVALRWDGGEVRLAVDAMGEGLAELALFSGLLALGTVALARALQGAP